VRFGLVWADWTFKSSLFFFTKNEKGDLEENQIIKRFVNVFFTTEKT
jgi:hypothetical protein